MLYGNFYSIEGWYTRFFNTMLSRPLCIERMIPCCVCGWARPFVQSTDISEKKWIVFPRCILRRTVAGTHINNFRPKKHLKMKKPVCCSLAVTRYQGVTKKNLRTSMISPPSDMRWDLCVFWSAILSFYQTTIYIFVGECSRERWHRSWNPSIAVCTHIETHMESRLSLFFYGPCVCGHL